MHILRQKYFSIAMNKFVEIRRMEMVQNKLKLLPK